MKILIFSQPFYPIIGGSVVTTHYLATVMSEQGHNVIVLTPTPDSMDRDKGGNRGHYCVVRTSGYFRFAWFIWKSDIVIIKGGLSKKIGLLSVLLRKKFIPFYEGSGPLFASEKGLLLHNVIAWSLARLARYSLAVSDFAWKSKSLSSDCEHYVVRNPVNPLLEEKRFRNGIPAMINRPVDVSYVGSITAPKGALVFMKALAELDAKGIVLNVNLVGPIMELNEEIKEAVNSFCYIKCNVFCAHNADELHEVYASTKCLVNPSMMTEGAPLTVIDAFLYGIPVIISDYPALLEVVGDAGASFRRGDHVHLADTIERVLDDHELLQNLSENSLRRYADFSFEKWKEKIRALPEL